MGIFSSKFKKIKRTDVVEQILNYQNEMAVLENRAFEFPRETDELVKRGRQEKNLMARELIAQKILQRKKEFAVQFKRIKFLQYNIDVLENIKIALDDVQFASEKRKNPLNKLLANSKNISNLLENSHKQRSKIEGVLISATTIIDDFESIREQSDEIYGTSEDVTKIMAMFENDELEKEQLEEINVQIKGEINNGEGEK